MAKPSFEQWKKQTIGQKIDLDNQSFDCVDVPKSWAQFVTGKPWQQSLCWGNAKDIWVNCPATYWTKIQKGNRPKIGDIVCMSGAIGGGYGHVGVVIAVSADGRTITIAQQNTFTQQAVYTGVYDANASFIQGYLRSKVDFDDGTTQALQGFQRIVGSGGVNYRKAPNRGGEVIQLFPEGDVLDFKGFVRGENVDSNELWFVGAYTGGYAWAGGFTDVGTHDLPDLTPAAALQPFQRQVAGDVMNYRKTPYVAPDNVIKQFNPGEVLDFDAWAHGMSVDGNDVWFRGKHTAGWIWSGGFTDKGTHDLPEVAPPSTTPTPTPSPIPTPAYSFVKDLACVTEVIPAGDGSFEHGNFPEKPEKVVIHDFGTLGVDTVGSTINWFKKENNISAHFVVSGKRIIQMVSLKDRAYHAGPNGNMYVGIETDPAQDEETKASVNLLLKALALYYGYVLTPVKHSSIMNTNCGDDINLANYQIEDPNPKPTPIPEPQPEPEPKPQVDMVKLLQAIITRAGKTFVQAFAATLMAGLTGVVNVSTAKALFIAALAAGASAAWNAVKPPEEAKK